MDFVNLARKSAHEYLDYLRHNGKGKKEIKIQSIRKKSEQIYHLTLDAKLFHQDNLDIIAHPQGTDSRIILDKKKYTVQGYDEDTKILVISVSPGFDAFSKHQPHELAIEVDLTFLTKVFCEWFDMLVGEEAESHATRTQAPTSQSLPTIEFPPTPASLDLTLDLPNSVSEEQQHAIRTALTNPLSYIWGAPGTGKTQKVLAHCLLHYIHNRQKIILLAPTNQALEQSLRGVLRVMKDKNVDNSCVLRMGVPTRSFLREYPLLCENAKLVAESEMLQKEIVNLKQLLYLRTIYEEAEDKLQLFQSLLTDYRQAEAIFRELSNQLSSAHYATRLRELGSRISSIDIAISSNHTLCISLQEKTQKKSFKFKCLFNHSLLPETEKQIRILKETTDRQISEKEKLLTEKRQLTATQAKIQKEIKLAKADAQVAYGILWGAFSSYSSEFSPNLDAISEKLHRELDTLQEKLGDSNENVEALSAQIEQKQQQLKRVQGQQHKSEDDVLILACTVDTFLRRISGFSKNTIAHIFLDEAAYCPLIKSAPLFTMHCPITMLGDHMQLPPVCEMDSEEIARTNSPIFLWSMSAIYFSEIFNPICTEASLFELFCSGAAPTFYQQPFAPLTHTYRFGNNLASILSNYVYPASFSGSTDFDTNILLIDVNHKTAEYDYRFNDAEINAIAAYLEQQKPNDFAILTPYRDQVKRFLRKLPKQHQERILTVHTSQGKEWDTVILSVVDCERFWYANSCLPKSRGKEIINTAISRAKKTLILCCDANYWRGKDKQLIGKLVSIAKPLRSTLPI